MCMAACDAYSVRAMYVCICDTYKFVVSLCSSSSLQIVRKLMLDYGGLDSLVELVSNCDDDGVQQTAISSLVFLLQSIKCQSSLRGGILT